VVALALAGLAGCGGSPTAPKGDEVFYLHGGGVIDKNRSWEVYYPKLDRDASTRVSRQFTFSIYERVDPDRDTWTEVQKRYEAELKAQGAKVVASRIPIGTANAQGRSYMLQSTIRSRPDFKGAATEILVRSDKRILLVQIVHPGNLEPLADEVAAAISTMVVY
jgi:hypothetical protein